MDGRRAVAEYMSHGPETRLGSFAPQQMERWIQATEEREVPNGYGPYHAAWMRAEAALLVGLHVLGGRDHGTSLDDYALLDSASERFDALASRPSNDPLLRARALIGLGSMSVYKSLSHQTRSNSPNDTVQVEPFYVPLMEASEILQRLASKRKDDLSLRHAIQTISFMGVLTLMTTESNAVVFAPPSRLSREEDRRAYDFLFWELTPGHNGIFSMRVTSAETGCLDGVIQIPTSLLREHEYPSTVGHGCLAALLGNHQTSKMLAGPKRRGVPTAGAPANALKCSQYLGDIFKDFAGEYVGQRYSGTTLSLEVDPINGLDEARAWYDNLSPLRRLVSYDMEVLDQCINPFENTFWAGDLSPQDVDRMGWIRAERALASGDVSELERATDLFEESVQTAEETEDWRRYCDALAAGVTTRLYGALQGEDYDAIELANAYASDLGEVITRLQGGLKVLEGQGPMHAPYVREVYERLAAAMILSSHPEGLYIAAIAPPRHRGSNAQVFGVDLMIIPLVEDRYQLHAIGRAQLTSGDKRNPAVAVVDPATIRPAIESITTDEDGALAWDETKVAAAHERVMALVEPVMFL
jgi:hypothetical protein